ncbi:LytTR family DNA-binding domain-containing protein [Turicibacter sanguinis]|uniref:LytR/AlgR family response regulator transcription factor n=1 Tax=Turicibacter sanguinis TaxID=154288 RepID=UPI002943DD13|nr:LytTR family DNA-binding domain-containing protein [Turicibacter sanguinis]
MKSYLNIGICDDNNLQLTINKTYLLEWATVNKLEIRLSTFNNAKEFLFEFNENDNFDLIILDIKLGDLNGIELAKKIREKNQIVKIIFITGYTDYSLAGYKVQALDYLIKPIDKKELFKSLDNYLLTHNITNEKIFYVEKGNKLYRFFYNEIKYFTSFDHYIDIYTTHQIFTFRGKISIIEEQLNNAIFYRCHRSYIVNIKAIKKITKNYLILEDNTQIPISRGRYKQTYELVLNTFNIKTD